MDSKYPLYALCSCSLWDASHNEHYGKPRVMVRDGGDRSPLAGNLRRDGGLCAT